MVRRHRGHAAPIVDPGGNQMRRIAIGKIWRRLDRHSRPKDQTGDRYAPLQIRQIRLRRIGHLGLRLGSEILDDHFLDLTETIMLITQGQQRVDPLAPGLADADQDAAGEWHFLAPGLSHGLQTHRRVLIGGTMVAATFLHQPCRSAFQHDPHTDRGFAQAPDLGW